MISLFAKDTCLSQKLFKCLYGNSNSQSKPVAKRISNSSFSIKFRQWFSRSFESVARIIWVGLSRFSRLQTAYTTFSRLIGQQLTLAEMKTQEELMKMQLEDWETSECNLKYLWISSIAEDAINQSLFSNLVISTTREQISDSYLRSSASLSPSS